MTNEIIWAYANPVELQAEADETYKNLTLQDWRDKSAYRGITKRSQKDFDNLIPMYVRKIGNIRRQLRGDWSATLTPIVGGKLKKPEEMGNELMEEIQYLLDKETRLIDKFATCVKEVQMRKDGDMIQTELHDATTKYIDYIGGNDGNSGDDKDNAWKTLTKYTTTEIRTAGDIAYVRANVTWAQGTETADITFDENGTDDDYISIIGCGKVSDGDVDPWADDNATKPIIDFESAAYQILVSNVDFWYLERLDIANSDETDAMVELSFAEGWYLKDCDIHDHVNAGEEGIIITQSVVTIDGCTFEDCQASSVKVSSGSLYAKGCTFTDGAGVGTVQGILVYGGPIYLEDCTFSGTFASGDLNIIATEIYARNCNWSASGNTITNGGKLYSEDDNTTFESQIFTSLDGIVTRDINAGNLHGGGANSSAKMDPSSTCGPNSPLTLGGNPLNKDFKIWLSAAEHTVTVYANRVDSDWAVEPVAANFYIQASYLSDGESAARSLSTKSTQDIANSDTWTGFTTTFTMAREGWAYIRVSLEKHELGKFVYVDIKPVVS